MEKKVKLLEVFREDLLSQDDKTNEFLVTQSHFHPLHGLLIEDKRFSADGQLEEVVVNEYDGNGFLTREELLDNDGTTLEKRTFENDPEGRLLIERIHYADDSADTVQYSYDADGNIVKKELFDEDNILETSVVFEYIDGLLTREATLGQDGLVLNERLCSYNKKDQLVEEVLDDREEGVYYRKTFVRDDNGNVIEATTFNKKEKAIERTTYEYGPNNLPSTITEENQRQASIVNLEYDQQRNILMEEEHDTNGELVRRIERKFTSDGLLDQTTVFVRNFQFGITRNYVLTNKYSFY